MTLDKLMYDWLKTQVSGLLREVDENNNLEPPIIEYMPTLFPRRSEAGDAESYPSVQVRIRVRDTSGAAYNGDLIDAAVDGVITDLDGQTPVLAGYVAMPLSVATEQPPQSNQEVSYQDVVFLTTISKGFSVTPLAGGKGTATIVGLDGLARSWRASVRKGVDYECTADLDEIETVTMSMPRASVAIDWILADSVTPLPVVGSTVSVVFAHGSNYAWVESVKISAIDTFTDLTSETQYQIARITGHVDSATSPLFTGDAA